jgi:hypothetical protein
MVQVGCSGGASNYSLNRVEKYSASLAVDHTARLYLLAMWSRCQIALLPVRWMEQDACAIPAGVIPDENVY